MVQAPPLLDSHPYTDASHYLSALVEEQPAALAIAAEQLASQPPAQRLGSRFESLVAALINASERFTLVARNLIISEQRRTLGELDMLVLDQQRHCLMHWELALKFYLAHGNQWLGPNSRDSLARKTRHLFEQQLPRSRSPAAQRMLAAQGWQVDERVLLTRGRLFTGSDPVTAHHQVFSGHESGWWCYNSELQPGRWLKIERSHWPTPFLSDKSTNIVASSELSHYVESRSFPVMVLCQHSHTPGFVVPSNWPDNDNNNAPSGASG